jgi:hypothetical protein
MQGLHLAMPGVHIEWGSALQLRLQGDVAPDNRPKLKLSVQGTASNDQEQESSTFCVWIPKPLHYDSTSCGLIVGSETDLNSFLHEPSSKFLDTRSVSAYIS